MEILTSQQFTELYPELASAVNDSTDLPLPDNNEIERKQGPVTCSVYLVQLTKVVCDETIDRTDIECSERSDRQAALTYLHNNKLREAERALERRARKEEQQLQQKKDDEVMLAEDKRYCARCCAALSHADRRAFELYCSEPQNEVFHHLYALHEKPIACPFCCFSKKGCALSEEANDVVIRQHLFEMNEAQLIARALNASRKIRDFV